ncbi:MAG: hypothetical protein HFJ54_03580 [Clostridia bacterium]|nr:hypothetical protein [Clostridia bacterium]
MFGVLSLEGSLTSSVDGITIKTTKAVVTSTIPVVGKVLGETVDAVLGCSNILKNAVGFVRNISCNINMYCTYNKTCSHVTLIQSYLSSK